VDRICSTTGGGENCNNKLVEKKWKGESYWGVRCVEGTRILSGIFKPFLSVSDSTTFSYAITVDL
jgi:hypothetical protein